MCGWFCWERSSWPCNKHLVIEFACNTMGLCCSCYKIVRALLQMDFVSTLKCTLSPFLAITLWDWKHKIELFSPSQFHTVSKMQKQPCLRLAKADFGKNYQGLKEHNVSHFSFPLLTAQWHYWVVICLAARQLKAISSTQNPAPGVCSVYVYVNTFPSLLGLCKTILNLFSQVSCVI